MHAYSPARSTLGWMFKAAAHHLLANEEDFTIHWCDGNTVTLSLPLRENRMADSRLPSSNHIGIDGTIILADRVFGIQATTEFKHGPPTQRLKKLRKIILGEVVTMEKFVGWFSRQPG